ncbi:MAG: response regulator, partial [Kofleriaceae bacterium]
ITVRDSGRGFAPELAGELFELYRTSSRQLGLGIGLALARALAEQHGGTITARSDGEGRGAELVVSLPLSTARVTTVVAPQAPAPAARRFRILITDDNRDAADTLADVMRDLGCEVAVAYDGGQAVEVARSFVPDLVLLDIGMPVLDGYEAARRIRSEAGGRPLSLVALTGWGQADDRQRARGRLRRAPREAGDVRVAARPPAVADTLSFLG